MASTTNLRSRRSAAQLHALEGVLVDTDEFGVDRLKEILKVAPNGNAKELCSSVLKAAGEFNPECPSDDDRTALAMIRTA